MLASGMRKSQLVEGLYLAYLRDTRPPLRAIRPAHFRHAHAAPLPADEEKDDVPGPSNSHKGKFRDEGQHYRFPEKGRGGGPPDPYEILGLERSATDGEIKQRCKLAMMLHPDSSHPSSSPAHFAMLHRAYTLLSQQQSRNSYLQTGFGWSPTGEIRQESWSDAQMRAEARARKRGGAAAWEAGHSRYRQSESQRSWNTDPPWQDGYDSYPVGKGEPRYMSNPRFLTLFGAVGILLAWVQYHRAGMSAGSHREMLQRQHVGASQALAEARGEAARFGKERRERIRRRVREMEVLNEVEHLGAVERDVEPP